MINSVSETFSKKLLERKLIDESEYEIYCYGMYSLMLRTIHIVSYLLVGMILDSLEKVVFFLAAFVPLRQYAGGYHAKSSLACFFISITTVTGIILLINNAPQFLINNILIISLIASAIIYFIAPVENANNPLNEKEKTFYQKRTRQILLVELSSIFILYSLNFQRLSFVIVISLVLVVVTLLCGMFAGLKPKGSKSI